MASLLERLTERLQAWDTRTQEREHFYVTDAGECPRKVLLRRMGASEIPQPSRIIFRKLAGFAWEKALQELLASISSPDLPQLLRERLPQEDLEYALTHGVLFPSPSVAAQFPFKRKKNGVEVRGRVDFIIALDDLRILEIKNTHHGQTEIIRKGKPYPAFLLQTAFYSQELSLPASLLVFSTAGEVREFSIQGNSCEGKNLLIGGLPPSEFVWKRLSMLSQLSLSHFPIEQEGQKFFVSFPENFPTHPDDHYCLVINRDGKPRAQVQVKRQTLKSFRCHSCSLRLHCYPNLPFDGKEAE